MNKIFRDNFYLEIQPHDLEVQTKYGEINQKKLNEAMVRLSHDMGIPYVITCDAHYRDAEHAKYHDFMLAIKDKAPVNDPNRFRYGVQDMYLKTHEEIESFFGKEVAEKGMSNSLLINSMCETPNYIEPKGPILPKFPIKSEDDYSDFKKWHLKACPETEEDKSYLRYKCIEGFKEKFGDIEPKLKKEYWGRVKKELKVLEEKDFSSYMLIVADYTNWAKKSGMPVGPARGCFIPGSKVKMSDGSLKSIENIKINDLVISHDDSIQAVTNSLKYEVNEELVELQFEDGKNITCTKDHEFFTTNRGWVKADDLNENDDIKEIVLS